MAPLILISFFVFIIALIVGLVIYTSKKEKERTLALQQAAQAFGFSFMPVAQPGMIPHTNYFNLFNQGHSRSTKNLVYGQINGVKAAVFDYRYTVGHGKHQHTYNQSVLYFETPRLQLPTFTLSPENFMHRFASALGYQDIDFAHRPVFSKKYLLRGQDEQGIRRTFTDQIMSFYEVNQGFSTEGGGSQLFVYRLGHRVPPAEAVQFLQWGAASILPLFARQW
jgi:hypothetical protein